jgi:hypothetical protein
MSALSKNDRSGEMTPAWFRWCEIRLSTQHDRINNLEITLSIIKERQKRMLYAILMGLGALIIYGVLLFNK